MIWYSLQFGLNTLFSCFHFRCNATWPQTTWVLLVCLRVVRTIYQISPKVFTKWPNYNFIAVILINADRTTLSWNFWPILFVVFRLNTSLLSKFCLSSRIPLLWNFWMSFLYTTFDTFFMVDCRPVLCILLFVLNVLLANVVHSLGRLLLILVCHHLLRLSLRS